MNPFSLAFLMAFVVLGWPIFVAWNEWKKFHARIENDLGLALKICSLAFMAEIFAVWCATAFIAKYIGWSWHVYIMPSSPVTLQILGLLGLVVFIAIGIFVLVAWSIGAGFLEYEKAQQEDNYA